MAKCKDGECHYSWYMSWDGSDRGTNETGWQCMNCQDRPGEPPGFSPQLDRSNTFDKVMGIMLDLAATRACNFSNSTDGMMTAEIIAARCREEDVYDQWSICEWIFEYKNRDRGEGHGHRAYWKRIAEGVLSGNDPRDRCEAHSELANHWVSKGNGEPAKAYCNKCYEEGLTRV